MLFDHVSRCLCQTGGWMYYLLCGCTRKLYLNAEGCALWTRRLCGRGGLDSRFEQGLEDGLGIHLRCGLRGGWTTPGARQREGQAFFPSTAWSVTEPPVRENEVHVRFYVMLKDNVHCNWKGRNHAHCGLQFNTGKFDLHAMQPRGQWEIWIWQRLTKEWAGLKWWHSPVCEDCTSLAGLGKRINKDLRK